MSFGSLSSTPGQQERSGYKLLPMKCGSRTGLPLVPCPKCGEEILELVATAGSKVPGAIFFKCRLHERDYERLLVRMGVIEATRMETEQPVPVLSSEVAGVEGAVDGITNAETVLGLIRGLDAKLKKLVVLEHIGVVCIVFIAVFVVLGVIKLLVK